MENQTLPNATKSNFVNVFAWIMIVLNGFGLFISIMQNVMFAIFFQIDEFQTSFSDLSDFPEGFPTFIFKNIRWLLPTIGVFILFALLSSIGLLRRKEWARKAFLFLLGLGIVYIIAASIFQIVFTRSMFNTTEMPSEFSSFSMFFIVFMLIISIGFIVLLGWLFRKLSSDKIKAEFIKN